MSAPPPGVPTFKLILVGDGGTGARALDARARDVATSRGRISNRGDAAAERAVTGARRAARERRTDRVGG